MQHVIAPNGVFLPALGRPVAKGEEVEVDDETAASLIEQGWTSKRSAAAKKAAKQRTDNTADVADEKE